MLSGNEKNNRRGRLGLGLVRNNRRPKIVPRSDDFEPGLRIRGNGSRRTFNGHWCGSVQDNESWRTSSDGERTVSRKRCERSQKHDTSNFRRSSQSYIRWVKGGPMQVSSNLVRFCKKKKEERFLRCSLNEKIWHGRKNVLMSSSVQDQGYNALSFWNNKFSKFCKLIQGYFYDGQGRLY